MMTNLFSIFDSNTNMLFEMNWLSSIFNILLLPLSFWFFQPKMFILINKIYSSLLNEFKNILIFKINLMNSIFLISLFFYILSNNLMGMFPFIFTSSSHMIFSISISLPLWLGLMLFGWINNSNIMFSHMIPQGTPNILMPFMVLIETTSNLIRPSTLTIRLTANVIAGHLLMTLLSQNNFPFILMILLMFLQIMLLILEFSVSFIQSYVFTILSTMYSKETN